MLDLLYFIKKKRVGNLVIKAIDLLVNMKSV